jgi:TetR/AcrR family transcriptional regulator, cholesterol catabolism regulator
MVIRTSKGHSDNITVVPVRPSPTRPALKQRYERRHDELVRLAAHRFAQRGYDQTTMQELAASMGLATGALYHYFASKEELLRAVCDQLMEPLLIGARELAASSEDGERRLRELVRLWVAHVVEHRDHMLVFQQERHMIESGERWRSVRDARKAFERLVADTLADVTARVGEPLSLLALLGMVNHTAQWYRPGGRLRPEDVADGYLDLLVGRP